MKAIVYDGYGGIERLELRERPAPRVHAGGVVVAVSHASLNPKDVVIRRGKFRLLSGRRFPKQGGVDYAGTVVESRVADLPVGQRVFGMLDEFRFLRGTLAERVAVNEEECAPLPDDVDGEAAAAVALTGSTALQALRDVAFLRRGQRLLVHGASGGVGTMAIQIGRLLGARVTASSSPGNHALCRSLGAEETVTYDGVAAVKGVDVVFDVFGNLGSSRAGELLGPRGTFVTTVPSPRALVENLVTRLASQPRRMVEVKARRADLVQLAAWLADRQLKAVIDSRHPLERIHEAFRVLESRHARGKIVVEVLGH